MSNYSKDTQFYHITGPGLVEGVYGTPALIYYNSFMLNDSDPDVVDGKLASQNSYPGNFIFIVPVKRAGTNTDDIIAAVYNRSASGEIPNPDVIFHLTSSTLRTLVAGTVGVGVAAGEIALVLGTGGASTVARAALTSPIKASRLLAKSLANWGSKAAGAQLKLSTNALKEFAKFGRAGAVFSTTSIPSSLLSSGQIFIKSGFRGLSNNQAARLFKTAEKITKAGSYTSIAAGFTASGILTALIPGAAGYFAYQFIFDNYSSFLNPYKIRDQYIAGLADNTPGRVSDLALWAVSSPIAIAKTINDLPSLNVHEMPWYTIEISPTKTTPNKLNKEGGLVRVKENTLDLDKLKSSTSALNRTSNRIKEGILDVGDLFVQGSINDREERAGGTAGEAMLVDKIYLDFWKPIDFVTIVALIQMLDVQNPLYNGFSKHRSDIESLITKEALSPILRALEKTSQYQTLNQLNKALSKVEYDESKTEQFKQILNKKQSYAAPVSLYEQLELLKIAVDVNIAIPLDKVTAEDDNALAVLLSDIQNKNAEIDDLSKFRDRLKKDVEKVFVPGSVQANIDAGTNFGKFCLNYINVFNTLSQGWVTGPKKKSSSVKAKKAALQKALTTATPNLAKLSDQREAELAEQRIIKVPFKKTANFAEHADFITPLSVLDEMRTEKSGHLFDRVVDIENIANSAPIPTTDDFINSLASLSGEQRNSLRASLEKRKKLNLDKSAKIMQDLKRMQFSPRYLTAVALSGASGLFPIRTTNGVIDLPEINIESITSIINNSINNQINAVQSQVINAVSSVADGVTDVVKSSASIANRIGLEVPFDASFIKIKNNTYSQKVSKQLDDIKNILSKPGPTASKVKTIKQESVNTLRQYQDLCEELQKLQVENVKIDAYIQAIDRAASTDKKSNYKDLINSTQKKIDSVIVKKTSVAEKVNQSIAKSEQAVDDVSGKLVAKINPAAESKPKVIL